MKALHVRDNQRDKEDMSLTFFFFELLATLGKIHEASDWHIIACPMTAKGAELSGPNDADLWRVVDSVSHVLFQSRTPNL